jgi:toxin ParE1/3/4
MAALIWTVAALNDLEAIADYIALDNPEAASQLVQRVFNHVEQLAEHPQSGSKPPELQGLPYRQIVEPPCRIFYRADNRHVYILYVMRGEASASRRAYKTRPFLASSQLSSPLGCF